MSETFVAGDLESQKVHAHVALEWHDIQHKIGDKAILSGVSGRVESGEMLAVMGPSGAGKSTLLDILSKRIEPTHGTITVDGNEDFSMRSLGAYVEQSDALLGVLSVRETINFAARLSLDPSESQHAIRDRVETTISELGLMDVANSRIGNAVQRGISGGQKRRVTIGSALVTKPSILLLDEPTSGLDSRTSREVMAAIKSVAERHKMIVVASIHQPNWETFALFDKLLLLAQGRTMYFGPIMSLTKYLTEGLNHAVPIHANPADIALDLINTDFIAEPAERHIDSLATKWDEYAQIHSDEHRVSFSEKDSDRSSQSMNGIQWSRKSQDRTQNALRLVASRTWILMERNTLNYSRNLLAYGVRLGMYLGMGILLATVWVNLAQTSAKVNDRLSVHFFSVAFLGFMSVAGIPAFLEERQVFVRERMNGLYGPGAYVLANSIVTLPYLFLCVVLFSVICYWSIGLNPGADQFFRFLAILYLAVYAAESQSTVVAAIFPVFVAALAIAAFLNGFWMCVGGYFIRAVNLPRFWYYWAHFIDYQTYAFDLLVRNDFRGITLACTTLDDGSCFCDYPSSLISSGQCALAGDDVLKALGIDGISFKLYAVILLLITLLYRFLFYLVLVFKKR